MIINPFISFPPAGGGPGIGTVSFVNITATIGGTTSLSLPLPASRVNGNMMMMHVVNKHPPNGPATPSGWTAAADFQVSGGAGASGADTGNVYVSIFYRIITGSESGNQVVTITSGNVALGWIMQFSKSAGTWDIAMIGGADNSSGTAFSATAASDPGVFGGDMMVLCCGVNSDAGAAVLEDDVFVTQSGITYAAPTVAGNDSSTTGNDERIFAFYSRASSGTSSAPPVAGTTFTSNVAGAVMFVRLRAA